MFFSYIRSSHLVLKKSEQLGETIDKSQTRDLVSVAPGCSSQDNANQFTFFSIEIYRRQIRLPFKSIE